MLSETENVLLRSPSELQKKIEQLRSITGVLKIPPPPQEGIFWEQPGVFVPRGKLHEISGRLGGGKTEALLRFISKNQSQLERIAWIEEQFTAYPFGFLPYDINLNRLFFIESGSESLWTMHQVLRSQLFGLVVLAVQESTLDDNKASTELRRLQLSAEQSQAYVFLITEKPRTRSKQWPITLQLYANSRSREIEVLKEGKLPREDRKAI